MNVKRQREKIRARDIVFILLLIALLAVSCMLTGCDRGLKNEIEGLREELARQQQYAPLKRGTIRDTVEVVTQKVVEVERIKEVLSAEDKALLKDIGVKVKEIVSYQKLGMKTEGEVVLDTATKDTADSKSATLSYHDAWADFEYYNRKLRYAVRDSLAIAIRKEYQHRFLFWKWGVKGYEVKAVNFNPHSSIRYNTYVKSRR